MDVPDLPMVLRVLNAYDRGLPLVPDRDQLFDKYCFERGISPLYLHSYLKSLDNYLASVFSRLKRVDFVGFSVWTTNYLSTLMAAAHLKRRAKPPLIIVGGPHATDSLASAALGLRSGLFDIVAHGEGEETLLQVYRQFNLNNDVPNNMPGTVAAKEPNANYQRLRRPPLPMRKIPTPSFSEMCLETYQDEPGLRSVPLQFSRGCTCRCEFCSEWALWHPYRVNSAQRMVNQIEELKRGYGVNFVQFSDSLLNGSLDRLISFVERLLHDSVEISWGGFMRAQMDVKTAALLARAGCNSVFLGIESFSDNTLTLMNKRRTKLENIEAIEAFLSAGIEVTAGFVPGFPGDPRNSFLKSASIFQNLQEKHPGCLSLHVEPFLVQPNAPIYSRLEEVGLTPLGWSHDYLDSAPRYRDITSEIICSVSGENQGIERLGRLRIIKSIDADELSTVSGFFPEEDVEALCTGQYDFEHIFGGWYLASRKIDAGHTVALLMDQSEMEEMDELQFMFPGGKLSHRRIRSFLARLERRHIAFPSRRVVRIVRGLYKRRASATDVFAMSPFVVARSMDWRYRHQVLTVDIVSGQSHRIPSNRRILLNSLRNKPQSENDLRELASTAELPQNRHQLREWIDDLKEKGILVICDERRSVEQDARENLRDIKKQWRP
jgi:radical SAM superfamily enzyme YgiQ (UPF0313 family)